MQVNKSKDQYWKFELHTQLNPITLNAPESISPSIAGKEPFDEKYAKYDGCCQCVIPGKMYLSTSFKIVLKSSGSEKCKHYNKKKYQPCGASVGSNFERYPGCTVDSTIS